MKTKEHESSICLGPRPWLTEVPDWMAPIQWLRREFYSWADGYVHPARLERILRRARGN